MAKIILFEGVDYSGRAVVRSANDQNLALNGDDITVQSLIVVRGSWNIYVAENCDESDLNWNVNGDGGPDADGCYRDYAEWGGDGSVIISVCG